jgi:hypothetical protein
MWMLSVVLLESGVMYNPYTPVIPAKRLAKTQIFHRK